MTFTGQLTIQRLTIAILFILLFAMAVRVPTDTDTWWHIRSGETIVDNASIPHSDSFSHTRDGADWIDHSWGAQVALYGAYELFGGGRAPGSSGNIGLALFTAALATLGMLFVFLMCEGNAYVRAFVVVLGAAAAAVFWSPRPQMVSFALGALVLYLIHTASAEHIDRLWLIPPIFIIWVNMHGGFAIGFVFLLGTIAGEVIGNLLNPGGEHVIRRTRLRKLAWITALAVPAVALNPYGIQMLQYPFRTVGIGVLQDFIQEWASPNFHQPQTWPFAVLLLGVLAAAGLSSRRIDWTDLALVAGTALMGLMAGRNIAVFAIAATPCSRAMWIAGSPIGAGRFARLRTCREDDTSELVAAGLVALGGLAKVVSAVNATTVRDAQERYLPVELGAFLDDTPPDGLMFNSYNWGGYLMFAAPDVPVYVDGRTDLYDDAFLRDYLDIAFVRDGWDEQLDEQGIGFVAIEADSFLATMLRARPEQWREQRFDEERSALFVRTREEGAHD